MKLYDQDLKLLYYCWQWNLNTPISTIAPHSMNFDLKDLANICNNTDFKNGSSIVDDISIERKPLFLRDFLIGKFYTLTKNIHLLILLHCFLKCSRMMNHDF